MVEDSPQSTQLSEACKDVSHATLGRQCDTQVWHVFDAAIQIANGAEQPGPAELGIDIPDQVLRLVSTASSERLLTGFDRLLSGPQADKGLQWLHDTEFLAVLIPEVSVLDGFHEGCAVGHKDLWKHTLEVVARTERDADLRWIALMHDTGKVATRSLNKDGQVTFYGHERVSAWLMRGVGGRFKIDSERIERICFVIEHHGRVNAYRRDWTDKAVRRLIRATGDRLDDIMSFARADFTTKRKERVSRIRGKLKHLSERIEGVRSNTMDRPDLPHGLGKRICQAMNRPQGPWVGEHMDWLREEISSGRLPNGADISTYLQALIAQKG
jgi:poly(A) polymerase